MNDIESLIDLRVSLLKEVDGLHSYEEEGSFRRATEQYLQVEIQTGNFIAYIATVNEKVVSISGVTFFHRPPYIENLEGKEAYILNMYTLPKYRGHGIAKKLLEYRLEECKENGVKRIWLHSSKDGEPLYKKIGFTNKQNEMELFLLEKQSRFLAPTL
ncbi:GNAT family N-acetyltransferase [Bacillus bingmayongensis]|uniref:GNAT family N-acetyltransferase n=1 Tax=Bacillus bingmayongensis TaxID=1150157 RepID=UPI000553685F|nr:GNAT family N-acetyltransferase [Bacillus bingmayongensis]